MQLPLVCEFAIYAIRSQHRSGMADCQREARNGFPGGD